MDRTLLPLLVLTGVLVAMLAPHATLTLLAVVILATVVTQGSWVILQTFGRMNETRRALD